MASILYFRGQYRWLSNFWPCTVTFECEKYTSVENAYVAAKTFDKAVRKEIQVAMSPGEAKRFGRKLELRHDWWDVRMSIMEELLRQKFTPGSALADCLVATGNVTIVEGNSWGDKFWGMCDDEGENHLGRLLMKIRRDLLIAKEMKHD